MTNKGLLLAAMEPAASEEEEFHDWYDTEHIPERAGIKGFINARRFVCIDGWPRYVAIYDLEYVGVLEEAGYVNLSGERFSPWSKRVLARVHGQYRAEGVQIYPGGAVYGEKGPPARVMLLRFRNVAMEQEAVVTDGLRSLFESAKETLQVRVFRSKFGGATDILGIVELKAPLSRFDIGALGQASAHLDMLNTYVPYWRRGPLHGVFKD